MFGSCATPPAVAAEPAPKPRDLAISAALPYWLDRLPPEGRVTWRSVADRDAWFTRLLARKVSDIEPSRLGEVHHY